MNPSHPNIEIYSSPKRKRGEPDSVEYSPQPSPRNSRIITNPLEFPFTHGSKEQSQKEDNSSPSSKVTGQLQTLHLQGTFVRQLAFADAGHTKKRFAQSGTYQDPQNGADETTTQHLRDSPMTEPANVVHPTDLMFGIGTSTSSSSIVERPRVHSRSPPLDGDPEDNPMTWHESEITGHNPTDPNDDGYGINGIGFRPTPAIAWARSQRRKQQLADYKNREAREARQRRSERRRAGSREISVERAEHVQKKDTKVRFGDIG